MVGVAENNARVKVFEHFLCQRFDRAARADGHKDGRFNFAVSGFDNAKTGFSLRVSFLEFKKLLVHK